MSQDVLAIATAVYETSSQSVLELWGKTGKFSFPLGSMGRFQFAASCLFPHQKLSSRLFLVHYWVGLVLLSVPKAANVSQLRSKLEVPAYLCGL